MLAHQFTALRHKQFLKFWLGSFTSVGATQLQVMGLGWLVYELSSSSLALGYLGAAAGLPAIVTTLFGGALADQINKRMLLIVTSVLIAVLLALLAYLDWAGIVQVWQVIAIAGAISIITGFDWPARQSIFPSLIERKDMMSAVALTTVIWQATRMVMPALGGLIIAISDTWLLFAFCSAGFFLMFLILISLSYAVFFFASSYMPLMPAFADMLNVDEKGYGYLLSITGVGAVIGTVISGSLQKSPRLGLAMLLSALIFCVFVFLFALVCWLGIAGAFYFALGILFSASIFSSIFMVTTTTILQLEVPEHLRGRVMGFHGISYSLFPLGALLVGTIANVSNPSVGISISTTIFVAYLLWVSVTQPGIRKIDGRALTEKAAQATPFS
ncbi:MAG: MFS transporter [Gammaproteobacteria bacterium]|nr:MFS transporter [Gammaproteobacteria bacterium]MBT4616487.1 MFS transporter [Gammaproteobacteria bacterium]MBT7176553.1 MFS transporter [Gammaproteobacteria bacterium]